MGSNDLTHRLCVEINSQSDLLCEACDIWKVSCKHVSVQLWVPSRDRDLVVIVEFPPTYTLYFIIGLSSITKSKCTRYCLPCVAAKAAGRHGWIIFGDQSMCHSICWHTPPCLTIERSKQTHDSCNYFREPHRELYASLIPTRHCRIVPWHALNSQSMHPQHLLTSHKKP